MRGRFGLAELEGPALADPELLALCERVECEHDEDSAFPQYFSGQVEVVMRDGRRLERRERVNHRADARPLSRAQAQRVLEAVMTLDRAPDLGELCASLALA